MVFARSATLGTYLEGELLMGYQISKIGKEQISKYDFDNKRHDLANSILYKMVEDYQSNADIDSVVAKIWLIGRSYSASVERRKNKSKTSNGDFYYDYVGPAICRSNIDSKISALRSETTITENTITEVCELHKCLMDILQKQTEMDKRSLASKYLHFHLPGIVFIYDSRVQSVISSFVDGKGRIGIPPNVDEIYYRYCLKAFEVYKNVNSDPRFTGMCLPRIVDNVLLAYASSIGK